MTYPDMTNVVIFPEPSFDQLQEQRQKVDDLLEEAHINFKLNGLSEDLIRIKALEARSTDLYEKLVSASRDDIMQMLNSA